MRILITMIGVLAIASAAMAGDLASGMETFDNGFTSGVANGWTKYLVGGSSATFANSNGNPSPGQRMDYSKSRPTRYNGMYQTLGSNVGDAFTFAGQAYCLDNGNNGDCSIRVDFAGGTDVNAATKITNNSGAPAKAWFQLPYVGTNATGTSATVFVDVRAYAPTKDLDTYWDNIVAYRAHVPPAAAVGGETAISLDVDVDAGGNAGNANAQFAVVINGGSITDGYVQADGSVGGAADWQTEALWDVTTVTGLDPLTEYTFEVMARYSSTISQATSRVGVTASGTTTPEPAALALLGLGLPLVVGRRRRK